MNLTCSSGRWTQMNFLGWDKNFEGYHIAYIQTDACKTRHRALWDVTIAGPPRRPVWCRLYGTVYRRKWLGYTQNGGTVLPIANLTAHSESGSPDSYSNFLVTIHLSHSLVLEIFACDRQTDGRTTRTITIAGPNTCGGPARNIHHAATMGGKHNMQKNITYPSCEFDCQNIVNIKRE